VSALRGRISIRPSRLPPRAVASKNRTITGGPIRVGSPEMPIFACAQEPTSFPQRKGVFAIFPPSNQAAVGEEIEIRIIALLGWIPDRSVRSRQVKSLLVRYALVKL